MAEKHEAIKKALGEGKKGKTHTHGVHYERADNGGYTAHVTKHHGPGPHSEGHSHEERHVLPDKEAAAEHFDEHMGDQPAAGEMQPPEEAQNPAEQGAAGAMAGAGAGPTQGM